MLSVLLVAVGLPDHAARQLQIIPCVSTFDSDTNYETCLPWCTNDVSANCDRCKCKACNECVVHNQAVAESASCTSSIANDYTYEACFPWCTNNLALNCPRCKCARCPECRTLNGRPVLPPPPLEPALESPPPPGIVVSLSPPPPSTITLSPPASPTSRAPPPLSLRPSPSLPVFSSGASAQKAQVGDDSSPGMSAGSIAAAVIISLLITLLLIFIYINRKYVFELCCARKTSVAEVAVKVVDPLDERKIVVQQVPNMRSPPPRLKRRPIEDSDELIPTDEELKRLQMAQEKEARKKRVASNMNIALARFGKRHLALGFTTWKDGYLKERQVMNMLKRAVGGLARPKLVAAVDQWKTVWVAHEQARAVAEMRKADAAALAQQAAAAPQRTKTWSSMIWNAIVPEDDDA